MPSASKVEVVARLPGLFVGPGEIENLHIVDDVRIGFCQVREGGVAVTVLIANAEGVGAGCRGQRQRSQLMIDLERLITIIAAVEPGQIDAELPVSDWLGVNQIDQILVVDVLKLRAPEANGGVLAVEGVAAAKVVEAIGCRRQRWRGCPPGCCCCGSSPRAAGRPGISRFSISLMARLAPLKLWGSRRESPELAIGSFGIRPPTLSTELDRRALIAAVASL